MNILRYFLVFFFIGWNIDVVFACYWLANLVKCFQADILEKNKCNGLFSVLAKVRERRVYLKRFGFLLLSVSAVFCTPVFAAITSKEYVDEHVKNQVSTLATKAEIPTKVSDLTNDSGFITAYDIPSAPNVPTKVSEFENDAKYVTETAMGTELGNYAKTADVNTELAKKANASELASYATTTAMNNALSTKADSSALNNLATKTEVSEGLAKKQNTLSTAQQAAVDSGVTSAKVATYDAYADQISAKANAADLSGHIANTANPHAVTKSQVGLANVQNVDQTNASNLTSGTVAYGRLPVGTAASTVAAGNDVRFNTIPTTQPSGTPPSGQVFIWFN